MVSLPIIKKIRLYNLGDSPCLIEYEFRFGISSKVTGNLSAYTLLCLMNLLRRILNNLPPFESAATPLSAQFVKIAATLAYFPNGNSKTRRPQSCTLIYSNTVNSQGKGQGKAFHEFQNFNHYNFTWEFRLHLTDTSLGSQTACGTIARHNSGY